MGQGDEPDRSVRLGFADEERAMLLTMSLFHDELDDDDQQTNYHGADFKLELGAYPWADHDLTTPVAPTIAGVVGDGAKVLAVSMSAALIAMSVY